MQDLSNEEKHDSTNYKEPVDSMYDIPEGSEIVNNIVVDEHSKRLKKKFESIQQYYTNGETFRGNECAFCKEPYRY